ncbi:hypothetical protein BV20DRAFT_964175 [Pilatotrama ljubarskyi]|nr:hypothetical protein BV20DRAFT_964175 [Pilatotrama ljubarskyi]
MIQINPGTIAALAAAIVATVPFALAASCYSQGGCQHCEDRNSTQIARENFCGSDKWSHTSTMSWGDAHVVLDGRFAEQQECFDGFQQIIDQCHGRKDGGIYNYDYNGDSATLHVGFCACE